MPPRECDSKCSVVLRGSTVARASASPSALASGLQVRLRCSQASSSQRLANSAKSVGRSLPPRVLVRKSPKLPSVLDAVPCNNTTTGRSTACPGNPCSAVNCGCQAWPSQRNSRPSWLPTASCSTDDSNARHSLPANMPAAGACLLPNQRSTPSASQAPTLKTLSSVVGSVSRARL